MISTDSDTVRSTGVESSTSGVNWAPIIAGALASTGGTLILTLLGSGLGLTMVSPWSSQSASLASVSIFAAIWLIVMQWLSAGVGGYLTGRLRTKWVSIHDDEVYFRDTAHGLLTWALATLIVIGFLGGAVSSVVEGGNQTASKVIPVAASDYFVDSLFRPADTRTPAAITNVVDTSGKQAAAILAHSAVTGTISPDDKTYLTQLVAAKLGLSDADAKRRVDTILTSIDDAQLKARQAAEAARKASTRIALFGTLSLLIGAFIAAVAAVIGGRERDNLDRL